MIVERVVVVVVVVEVEVEPIVLVMQLLVEWHSSQLSLSLHRLQIKALTINLNVPANFRL
jgi:hypothetical protein